MQLYTKIVILNTSLVIKPDDGDCGEEIEI
jgi:hypothetical protein